eukprot:6912889-Pyramimonas_sp.AAC.1
MGTTARRVSLALARRSLYDDCPWVPEPLRRSGDRAPCATDDDCVERLQCDDCVIAHVPDLQRS